MSIITVSGGNALTIGGVLVNQSGSFNPASIPDFRFWYDFSDLNNMWQDVGRTMPVTAAGQNIRSIANKFDITGIGGVTTAGEPFGEPMSANDVTYELASSDPSPGLGNPHGDFTANTPVVGLLADTPSEVMTDGVDSWTGYAVFPVTPNTSSTSIARKVAFPGAVNGGNLLGSFGVDAESNELGMRTGTGGGSFRRTPTKSLSNANEWIMQTVVFDSSVGGGTILTWRINGVDDIGNLSGTTGVGTAATYDRGISMGRTSSFDWQGRLGEVLVYRGQHNATQIGQVETYLSGKWNLDP